MVLAALLGRRALLARRKRAAAEAEARLQPWVFELLARDQPLDDLGEPPPLGAVDRAHLTSILLRYSRRLTGQQTDAIARYFERSGDVSAAIAKLAGRRAWKRAAAAAALGDMASWRAVPALLRALDDGDRAVRAAAARSLGRIGDMRGVELLVEALARRRLPQAVAAYALLQLGRPALPKLRLLAAEGEPDVRRTAVELIGLLGDARDADVVVDRLRDTAAEVRAAAAHALGRLGAERGTRALSAALRDRIPFVRAAAAGALGVVGDRSTVPPLLLLAQSDSFDPAYAAARAAARIDPDAVVAAAARSGASASLREAADLQQVAV